MGVANDPPFFSIASDTAPPSTGRGRVVGRFLRSFLCLGILEKRRISKSCWTEKAMTERAVLLKYRDMIVELERRIEKLSEERSEVYKEAKQDGVDVPALKKAIRVVTDEKVKQAHETVCEYVDVLE